MESYICNQLEGIGATDFQVLGTNSSFGIQAEFDNGSIQVSSWVKYKCGGIWPYLYAEIGAYKYDSSRIGDCCIHFPEIGNYEKTIPVLIKMIPKTLKGKFCSEWKAVKTESGYILEQI